MIRNQNYFSKSFDKPWGCSQKDTGAVPARGGTRAPNYCGLGDQTGQGPLGTSFFPCLLQCLLLEAGHQTRWFLNWCSHSYAQLENAGNTSTKVSDVTWVLSTELDTCFEVPEAWEKMLAFKYAFKFKRCEWDNLSNYSSVTLIWFSGEMIEKLIWDLINKKLKKRNIINANQNGFTGNKSCQTNLISFWWDYIKFVGKGSTADAVRLFKAFVVVPHSILTKKLG